jgi:predicted Zn-dependent protease
MTDNRVEVSGQVAVMAINERLLRTLMAKNPDASFAIEQSFPFASMYPDASPLGPIMELRVQDAQNVLTPERAAQSVDYWRATAQELLSDPSADDLHAARMTYAKMAAEQAALLLARNFTAEAEQAFRLATEIGPGSPEAVFRYVNLLVAQGRLVDAIPLVEAAVRADVDNQQQFRALRDELNRIKKN